MSVGWWSFDGRSWELESMKKRDISGKKKNTMEWNGYSTQSLVEY